MQDGATPQFVPLADVREENVSRSARYKGAPTLKATAAHREAERKHGARVYESARSLELRDRLDFPEPVPPRQPRNPTEGFDGRTVELANRGRDITAKAVDISPAAAYNQWRSLMRLASKRYGEECISESLYQEYYQAVNEYVERWTATQDSVHQQYMKDLASGQLEKGGRKGAKK